MSLWNVRVGDDSGESDVKRGPSAQVPSVVSMVPAYWPNIYANI